MLAVVLATAERGRWSAGSGRGLQLQIDAGLLRQQIAMQSAGAVVVAAAAGAVGGNFADCAGRLGAAVWWRPNFAHVLVGRLVGAVPRLKLIGGRGMIAVVVWWRGGGMDGWRVIGDGAVGVGVSLLLLLMVVVLQKLQVLMLLQLMHHQVGFELRMAHPCRCAAGCCR